MSSADYEPVPAPPEQSPVENRGIAHVPLEAPPIELPSGVLLSKGVTASPENASGVPVARPLPIPPPLPPGGAGPAGGRTPVEERSPIGPPDGPADAASAVRAAAGIAPPPVSWPPQHDAAATWLRVEPDDSQTDDEPHRLPAMLRRSPPWLVSCLVHAALVILLALIPFVVASVRPEIELVVGYTDEQGKQLELESLSDGPLLDAAEPVQIVAADSVVVEDPLQSPDVVPLIDTDGLMAALDIPAPRLGALLDGREEGMKQILLAAYGGSEATEAAVLNGLRWLHAHQDSDGLWSLSGRYRRNAQSREAAYTDGADDENKCAATALAMLAFQGYGQTHRDGPHKVFQVAHRKALAGLLKRQQEDGGFAARRVQRDDEHLLSHHLMYTQALCTFALAELYAMTKDAELERPAQQAVDYLVRRQDKAGGWRYARGSGSDLSVTGWVMMALQSARMGGLEVPAETLEGIEQFLERVSKDDGRRFSYSQDQRRWTLPMTAEGMLCRQYLGWDQDDPRMIDAAELIADNPVSGRDQNVYYWYYATQVLHNMEGDSWRRWNRTMSRELVQRQAREGSQRGSWSPKYDAWGDAGGRLYTTCLSIYMLEVYYRHLPIYSLGLSSSRESRDESLEPE